MARPYVQVFNESYVRLRDENFDVTIASPKPVLDACYKNNRTDGSASLYCITTDGSLYQVSRQKLENVRTKCNKNDTAANQEIFSDLLSGDDDYILEASTHPVYILDMKDKILNCHSQPLAMCVTDSIIAIATSSKGGKCVNLYDMKKLSSAQLSTQPESYLGISEDFVGEQSRKDQKEMHLCYTNKFLMKIISADDNSSDSDSVLFVNKTLYKLLFGQDVTLLSMPVVVVAFHPDHVYFAPVNTFLAVHTHIKLSKSLALNSYLDRWTLFCQTVGNVSSILTMSLQSKDIGVGSRIGSSDLFAKDTTYNALLICSESGQISVFHESKQHNQESCDLRVSIVMMPSPIVCCTSFGNHLYHSTGKEVFEHSLEKRTESDVNLVTNRRFDLVNIVLIQPVQQGNINHVTDSLPDLLVCCTAEGEHKVFSLGQVTTNNQDIPLTGETIQSLLTSLENIDSKHRDLEEELRLQDHWLKQIHLFKFMLVCQNNHYDSGNQENSPFSCKCKCVYSQYSRHCKLEVVITNQMPESLSHDWSLLVQIVPCESSSNISVVSLSQKLCDNFSTSQTLTLSQPLDDRISLVGAKVLVSAVLNMPNPSDDTKTVSLPVIICEKTIDVLFFLRKDATTLLSEEEKDAKGVMQSLKKIAENKPAYFCFFSSKCEKDDPTVSHKTISVVNHVSLDKETVTHLLNKYGPGVQYSLLKFLLRDSSTEIDPITTGDTTSIKCSILDQSVMLDISVAMDRANHSSTFESRETIGDQETCLLVTSHAEMHIVSAIHASITARLKKKCQFINITLQTSDKRKDIKLKDARTILRVLEDLNSALVRWRSQPRTMPDHSGSLAALYEHLRSGRCAL